MAAENPEDRELMSRLQAWLRWEQNRRGISQNALGELLGYQSGTMTKYMDPHGQIAGVGFVLRVYKLLRSSEVPALDLLTREPAGQLQASAPPSKPIASPPRSASSRPPATRQKKGSGGGLPT